MYTLGIQYYKGYQMPLYICNDIPENDKFPILYKMIFTAENSADFVINHSAYMIPRNSVLFLNEKDSIHEFHGFAHIIFFSPVLLNEKYTYSELNTKEKWITESDEYPYLKYFLNDSIVFHELNTLSYNKINDLVNKIKYQLDLQPDNFWPCRCKAYLYEILFHLQNPDYFDLSEIASDNLMDRIQNYMQKHITEDLSIIELTRAFNLNRTTLSEKFKKKFKLSPMKYINNQRIELSKNVLANTDVPIAEICSKIGVNSPAHFSKIFKAATGLTPSQYRDQKTKECYSK